MRLKLTFIIIILFLLSSCSFFNEYSWIGIEEIETIEEALIYMQNNIEYKYDNDDFWQLPEETYLKGTGDCEDKASLLAHLFIYNVNLNDIILLGVLRKTDYQPHMVVKIGDRIFEADFEVTLEGFYDTYYLIIEMSYENYIDIARLYHLQE